MLKYAAGLTVIVLGVGAMPPASFADPVSPIFGSAAVVPTTAAQNKSILGKGYYADLYGSYGIDYSYTAIYYGYSGDYLTATDYAYSAYQAFNAAAYYQYFGE